jgi:hypothetical protein
MEPLDLTKHAPRSPKEKLAGILFLPRTIDKIRASLPGGNIGAYHLPGGSSRLMEVLGITPEQLTEAVKNAQTDEDVAAWIAANGTLEHVEMFNAGFLGFRVADFDEETRTGWLAEHATLKPEEIDLVHEALIEDDRRSFAAVAN